MIFVSFGGPKSFFGKSEDERGGYFLDFYVRRSFSCFAMKNRFQLFTWKHVFRDETFVSWYG